MKKIHNFTSQSPFLIQANRTCFIEGTRKINKIPKFCECKKFPFDSYYGDDCGIPDIVKKNHLHSKFEIHSLQNSKFPKSNFREIHKEECSEKDNSRNNSSP